MISKFINRKPAKIGQKFNYLTVIGDTFYIKDKSGNSRAHTKCQCICGYIGNFRLDGLKCGERKSCGCKAVQARLDSTITHNSSHI